MKEKHLIPCGQESIYPAMKPYFAKHCSPSCGEQCEANASRHGCEPWWSNSRGFAKFFVQCTVLRLTSTFPHHGLDRYSLPANRHFRPLAWIANAVVIDVFITTPTRRKSVLKAWKYYAHTAIHSVSHSPASM